MKSIAYTYYDKTELTVSGSDKDHVLLIDSLDEAISTKQVSVQSGLFVVLGWWQRVKYIRKVRRENSHCAVYWCRLNSSTGFICVSDLCLAENTATDVEVFVESAKSVKAVHSQLMCIGAALPVAYSSVLLLLKGSIGVRHVYMLAGKPVFTRLLSPSSSIDQLIDSLQATQQHLINRGMLDGLPPILCHGLSKEVVNKLEKAWASARVDSLITVLDPTDKTITKTAASVSLLAVSTYQSQSWLKTWLSFLPEYAIGQVSRHRYRRLSIVCTTVSILLLLVLLTGTLILKRDSISAVLYLPSAIEDVKTDIRVGLTKSLEYSAQPQLMAQGLSRLDQLRSVQPVGPDVLLSSLSDVFEAHPHVQLNHLSWFIAMFSNEDARSTKASSRGRFSMEATQPDHLSVTISGAINATTLSAQQARFTEFKMALLSIEGVSEMIVEQTPVTQWQLSTDIDRQSAALVTDNFTLRFVLRDKPS